jgi:excisionase family DNA binding protein
MAEAADFCVVNGAARLLKVKPQTIRNWIAGELKPYRAGRRVRISRAGFDGFTAPASCASGPKRTHHRAAVPAAAPGLRGTRGVTAVLSDQLRRRLQEPPGRFPGTFLPCAAGSGQGRILRPAKLFSGDK